MVDERMVPLLRDGQAVQMAMTPRDFFNKRSFRKDDAPIDATAEHFQTAAEAGYTLGDRYEDLTEYDGPKSKRAYERVQDEKKAAHVAVKTPEPAKADDGKPKAEAKKTD